MMKFVALLTKKYDILRWLSNTIMVDGTGMRCHVICRRTNKICLCEHRNSDAHKVDFDLMLIRLGAYRKRKCCMKILKTTNKRDFATRR